MAMAPMTSSAEESSPPTAPITNTVEEIDFKWTGFTIRRYRIVTKTERLYNAYTAILALVQVGSLLEGLFDFFFGCYFIIFVANIVNTTLYLWLIL